MSIHKLFLLFPLLLCLACQSDAPNDTKSVEIPFLQPKAEETSINNQKDTLLLTERGTTVYLPKNSFVAEDGSPITEPIIFSIKEYVSLETILGGGLSTVGDEGLLETAGMFEIDVITSSGKKVKINPERPLRIDFAEMAGGNKENSNEFKLYSGNKENGQVVWTDPKPRVTTLIPLSMEDIFYFSKYIGFEATPFQECLDEITKDYSPYQNTWLATTEFLRRWFIFSAYSKTYSDKNCDLYSPPFNYKSKNALEFYLPKLELPLYVVDSLARIQLCKDTAEMRIFWANMYKAHPFRVGPRHDSFMIVQYKSQEEQIFFYDLATKDRYSFIDERYKMDIDTAALKKLAERKIARIFPAELLNLGLHNIDKMANATSLKKIAINLSIENETCEDCIVFFIYTKNRILGHHLSCRSGRRIIDGIEGEEMIAIVLSETGAYWAQTTFVWKDEVEIKLNVEKTSGKDENIRRIKALKEKYPVWAVPLE